MTPLQFFEKAVDALNRSEEERLKKYSVINNSFNALLVYLKVRPCYISSTKIAKEVILKEFPSIFKLKTVLSPGVLKPNFIWTTTEPPSPKKKDLISFLAFNIYFGKCLDYSCPGELQGDYPWQNRWSIHYYIHKESEPDKKFHIFAEICHKKDGFRSRLREFSKVATLISTDKVRWKVTKTYSFTPLRPRSWITHLDWKEPKVNFYNRGKENKISKSILDELWEILDYSIKNDYKKSISKDIDISSEDVEKIIIVFPNIYTFKEKNKCYLVESYHPI
jgi:hypothetical protein